MQSAATWLTDYAQDLQDCAQQLFNQKAASEWEWGEWCKALRDELNQVDPVEEARNGSYSMISMRLKSERYYPKFVAAFNERLATLNAADPDDRMGQRDQVKCFRTALMGTTFFEATEVDHSSNRPFNELKPLMDKCRSIFQSRFESADDGGKAT